MLIYNEDRPSFIYLRICHTQKQIAFVRRLRCSGICFYIVNRWSCCYLDIAYIMHGLLFFFRGLCPSPLFITNTIIYMLHIWKQHISLFSPLPFQTWKLVRNKINSTAFWSALVSGYALKNMLSWCSLIISDTIYDLIFFLRGISNSPLFIFGTIFVKPTSLEWLLPSRAKKRK